MSEKSNFLALNEEYQKCLNTYYDKFFDGEDVEINDNTCHEIRDKMKKVGDFYATVEKEHKNYLKEVEAADKKKK
jgi:hypothetical protein